MRAVTSIVTNFAVIAVN